MQIFPAFLLLFKLESYFACLSLSPSLWTNSEAALPAGCMATPQLIHSSNNYCPLLSCYAAPVGLKTPQPIVSFSYMKKETLILFLFSPAVDSHINRGRGGGVVREDMTVTEGQIMRSLWTDALLL